MSIKVCSQDILINILIEPDFWNKHLVYSKGRVTGWEAGVTAISIDPSQGLCVEFARDFVTGMITSLIHY